MEKIGKLRHSDKETERYRRAKGNQREMGAVMWLDRQREEKHSESGNYPCLFSLRTNGKIWMPN